ncbi:putative glucan endo-1,3-beta-D-glucosidase [Rosa chinensis]|uniref:glucan endo-1,3-beta-D-glucosidase n=1 Tax=Rosa chinensis TaxID=74649 RepID=A0A2P6S3B3_ROSCH|nr:putative glucan endo-1,3-beta-D-glucosidase [Rosa chinensis]
MLKKIRRRVKTLITKSFKKPKSKSKSKPYKPPPPPSPSPSPPSEPEIEVPTTMSPPHSHHTHKQTPFLFPKTQSTVLPDPSSFFSQNLLKTPLPTNSFFQNLTLKNGDQPEYFHPYLIKSASSSLSLCYPSRLSNSAFLYQVFNADLTISNTQNPQERHVISSFNDLSITLEFPSSNLRFFLVRGYPFLTCSTLNRTSISISTIHAILLFSSNESPTKYTIKLNNNQTWLVYTSSSVDLTNTSVSLINSTGFSGIVRIAVLPESDPQFESVLDRLSSCYPVSGEAVFTEPFALEYKWEKKGWGDLLMLAHPLHLKLIDGDDSDITVLENFKYKSIDGDLVGVVGDSWVLKPDPLIARAARLALIAEEVGYLDVIPAIKKYLSDTIEPWWDGTFGENGFLHDSKWGGIVTKQGSVDSGQISVLAKIDPAWGRKYRAQAYSLAAEYMNLGRRVNYPRLSCFDLYKLHSWAGGLTEFGDGRNQESTSEAVNAYYSAALLGLAYGDTHLVATGSMIAALEIKAAQMWWQVKEGDSIYEPDFTRGNRVVGVLWANKRDSGLWFAPPKWKECRLGIQLLPILPTSEELFSDVAFGVGERWKGFVYTLQGIYDKQGALEKIRNSKGYDDWNSLTNLLWWIHSRGEEGDGCGIRENICWFEHCH